MIEMIIHWDQTHVNGFEMNNNLTLNPTPCANEHVLTSDS